MTIIVEDGTIIANANSYVSRADCIAYHDLRGNTFSSSPADLMDDAIIRGTQYIDNFYRGRFGGRKVERTQTLQWPRYGAEDEDNFTITSDEIPVEVIQATCEASLLELTTPNSLMPVQNGGQRVTSESASAGPVSSSKTYSDMPETRKTITIINGLLAGLTDSIYSGRTFRS